MAKKPPKVVINPLEPPPFKLALCNECACRKECRGPVQGRGNPQAQLMVVGQNPSREDDVAREPFVGEAGKDLRQWLRKLGFPEAAVYLTNAVKCYTKDRVPTASETKTCREWWLQREVARLPKLRAILTLGKVAKIAVLGSSRELAGVDIREASRADITDATGRELAVFPIPQPSYYMRMQNERSYFTKVVLPELRKQLVELGLVQD